MLGGYIKEYLYGGGAKLHTEAGCGGCMQGGVLLLAEGFARLIGSGACRVAMVSLSGKESEGNPSAIERASYGGCCIGTRGLVLGGSGIECGL